MGFRVWGIGFGNRCWVLGPGFGNGSWGLGVRVWKCGLGFGGQGLEIGSGVLGFGFEKVLGVWVDALRGPRGGFRFGGLGIWSLGFRRFRVWGLGLRGLGVRVPMECSGGLGIRVSGFGVRLWKIDPCPPPGQDPIDGFPNLICLDRPPTDVASR